MRSLVGFFCMGVALLAQSPAAPPSRDTPELSLVVSKSVVLENATGVRRVLISNPEIAEAVAVSPNEVVVNGKTAGDATLVLWTVDGKRTLFDVHVLSEHSKFEVVSEELERELPGQNLTMRLEDHQVFLRGTVEDLASADRAVAIASTLGKVVDLLRVKVPAAEPQILLKVRFANVERGATVELGANFFSTGAGNMPGSITTGQFSPPLADLTGDTGKFTFSDALNVFLFRPDLNFGAAIKALENRRLLQILAEPNLLTMSGKAASFLAGGEFPYPTLQGGGSGVGQITVQFREFGVRIQFLPTITPRGTIRMIVTPEVSSLDFANGLNVQGFTVPGLSTRRVQTEIELASGQSFLIAGLLDNRLSETISKIPGLGDIPLLGKLFQSKSQSRNNSELLVMVTPELVEPIPAGAALPTIPMPKPFMKDGLTQAPANPLSPNASANQGRARHDTLPVETLRDMQMATGTGPLAQPLAAAPSTAINPAVAPAISPAIPVQK